MTAKRRIAHLTTVDSSLRYLLEAQLVGAIDAGYEVIGISAPGPDVDYIEALGVRHVALPSSTRSFSLRADAAAMRDLVRAIRPLDLDLLHTHNPKPGLYGRILGRLTGVPKIVNTIHGLYALPEDRLAKRAVVYSAEAVASRFSNAELIQNVEDLELLSRTRMAPRRKLSLLGNGVDLERFHPKHREPARAEIRRELGIRDDEVVIGIVARLVEEKGYRELFEAAATIGEPAVVLAVGPNDPERPDAVDPDLIGEAVARGARLVGHRPDVERYYHAMDVFVLPSYREGVPRGAMEAAASGLPIVATDVRGCRQAVENGVTGLLVPVRDADSLAGALRRLVADADERARMGEAGRGRAEREFDERDVVRRVLDCYAELLG